MKPDSVCPFHQAGVGGTSVSHWFPKRLNVEMLNRHDSKADPMGPDFDYAKEFQSLDYNGIKSDLRNLMTDSQDWWPADYGHYGPFFIRMAWHAAGTYRVFDGRGGAAYGQQRFAPINSWPDNTNLDRARRLLWPIKQKYGKKVSWADLIIMAGNVAFESMGLELFGFGGGRVDIWETEDAINWGIETEWQTDDKRYRAGDGKLDLKDRKLDHPMADTEMGLIYVNPEGPGGEPDIMGSANDVRTTFTNMGMNDEETVILMAGGHTFGKCHGAAERSYLGPSPENAPIEQMGFGWKSSFGSGKGADVIGMGPEGAWTDNPIKWDNGYFRNMFEYEWELMKSPAGAHQWKPKGNSGDDTVPDAADPNKLTHPIMTTADMALREDPSYQKHAKYYYEHPEEFKTAFAKAWYKLTHRDMGPRPRLLGSEVPEAQIWQDPIPELDHEVINESEADSLKQMILATGIPVSRLVTTAWASGSSFRQSDKRGGGNGARIRLEPMRNWDVNEPEELSKVLDALEKVQKDFNNQSNKKVSMADLIILAGYAAIEQAAKKGGHEIKMPFTPGRMDTTQDLVDVGSFATMEPMSDGFRNYMKSGIDTDASPEILLIDKANLLGLSVPEMTALLGGFRVLGVGASQTSTFTDRPEALTNDFFRNLLDMSTEWEPTGKNLYDGKDRSTGVHKYTATRVDLIFGSNSVLRAVAEVYACDDGETKLVNDFCEAFDKVMMSDRFDLQNSKIPEFCVEFKKQTA